MILSASLKLSRLGPDVFFPAGCDVRTVFIGSGQFAANFRHHLNTAGPERT